MATQARAVEEGQNKKGCLSQILAVIGVLICVLYLLNLSVGIVEVPDNLPFIGNLDEATATAFLLGCLRYLGIDLIPFGRKRSQTSREE